MFRAALPALLLSSFIANAQQVYTWRDKDGVEHFTDDASEVPKNARKTSGTAITTMQFPRSPNDQQQQVSPEAAQPSADDFAAWQAKFREARNTIEELKKLIAADEQIVSPAGLPVNGSYSCYSGNYNLLTHQRGYSPCGLLKPDEAFEQAKKRLAYNRDALVTWQNYLQDLERAASAASVPQKWRQ
ncbi:MAG: DUF4124 domain-containing protein [Myxococcaceae bacterium]